MDIHKIPAGRNPPSDVNVVVEIPQGGVPVKYEIDKASGAMFVDRFLHTAMFYPCNYGFIPHTLARDGDPLDALVVGPVAGTPVPVDARHRYYRSVAPYRSLPQILLDQITHFFQHYKDLEPGRWVKITRWG